VQKNCHRRTIAQLCQAIVKQQCLLHMSSEYGELGPLAAEVNWRVWGTPANFNRFLILASFLQRHRSMGANQTLHAVWPSPGLVHYINIFGGSARCKIHFVSKYYILLYWQRYCTALEQWVSAKLCSVQQGHHLCSAGWPLRWASAHILVLFLLAYSQQSQIGCLPYFHP